MVGGGRKRFGLFPDQWRPLFLIWSTGGKLVGDVICVLSCKVFYFPNCFWDTPLQCLQPIWWGIRLTLFCFFVPDSNNIHAQGVVGEITLYILPRGWRCICDTAPTLTPVASSGRLWHLDTTWSSPFQQNYENISHTFRCTFGKYLWMVGWQKKKSKACVASIPSLGHSQQPQPSTFLPSPFWTQLSSPKNASWQE